MKHLLKKNLSFVIIMLLFAIAGLPALQHKDPDVKTEFAAAVELMEKAVAEPTVPSISVAVAKSGRIIWEKAVGYANIAKQIKATPATAYSLASISKPITATGLMILQEKGLIDLNESANHYLGSAKLHSFTEDPANATVLRLLNHTTGLVTHWNFFYIGDAITRPSMEETINRYGILIVAPGTQYIYSNLGYGILEYIIERVSGVPYPEFMQEQVFKPLGMTDSAVYLSPGPEERVARRYIGKEQEIPFYDFDHRGASAVYCSARDLARFGMFHLKNHLSEQKQIIRDETIDKMKSLSDPAVKSINYRLGWSESSLGGYKAYSHGGGMPGVRTNLLLIPEKDIALVMLCNAGFGGLRPIGQTILEELISGLKQRLANERKPEPGSKPEALVTPENLLGRWTGKIFTYEGNFPVELVCEEKGKLSFRLTGEKFGGKKLVRAVGRPEIRDDSLNATFFVNIPTSDAARRPHQTNLHMNLKGDHLWGAASAYAVDTQFGLPYYISLTKNRDQ